MFFCVFFWPFSPRDFRTSTEIMFGFFIGKHILSLRPILQSIFCHFFANGISLKCCIPQNFRLGKPAPPKNKLCITSKLIFFCVRSSLPLFVCRCLPWVWGGVFFPDDFYCGAASGLVSPSPGLTQPTPLPVRLPDTLPASTPDQCPSAQAARAMAAPKPVLLLRTPQRSPHHCVQQPGKAG